MKIITFLALISLGITNQPSDSQLLPTKLRVTVIDGLGNFVGGASVSIYESEKDYLAGENAIAMLKTDQKGRVVFKDLKPISYYIEAKKGDMKNDCEGVVTSPLSEGRINKVNTVIE